MTDKEIDISSEEYREYVTESGAVYRIDAPIVLFITQSGSHRVVDAAGITHRPPRFGTEYVVRWKPNSGSPAYVA